MTVRHHVALSRRPDQGARIARPGFDWGTDGASVSVPFRGRRNDRLGAAEPRSFRRIRRHDCSGATNACPSHRSNCHNRSEWTWTARLQLSIAWIAARGIGIAARSARSPRTPGADQHDHHHVRRREPAQRARPRSVSGLLFVNNDNAIAQHDVGSASGTRCLPELNQVGFLTPGREPRIGQPGDRAQLRVPRPRRSRHVDLHGQISIK